jgi:hypothetical protein
MSNWLIGSWSGYKKLLWERDREEWKVGGSGHQCVAGTEILVRVQVPTKIRNNKTMEVRVFEFFL